MPYGGPDSVTGKIVDRVVPDSVTGKVVDRVVMKGEGGDGWCGLIVRWIARNNEENGMPCRTSIWRQGELMVWREDVKQDRRWGSKSRFFEVEMF